LLPKILHGGYYTKKKKQSQVKLEEKYQGCYEKSTKALLKINVVTGFELFLENVNQLSAHP
jgi:hypothetical protein